MGGVSTALYSISVGDASTTFYWFIRYYRDLLNSDLSLDTSLDLSSTPTERSMCDLSTTTDNPVMWLLTVPSFTKYCNSHVLHLQ